MARAYIDLNNISEDLNKRIEEIEEHLKQIRDIANEINLDIHYNIRADMKGEE